MPRNEAQTRFDLIDPVLIGEWEPAVQPNQNSEAHGSRLPRKLKRGADAPA